MSTAEAAKAAAEQLPPLTDAQVARIVSLLSLAVTPKVVQR